MIGKIVVQLHCEVKNEDEARIQNPRRPSWNSILFYRKESLPLSLLLLLFSLFFSFSLVFFIIIIICLFIFFFEAVLFFFIPVFHSDCKCLLRSLVFSLLKLNKNNNNSIILLQCLTKYCARNLEHNTGAFGDSVFTLMATLHCDSKDPTRVLAKKRWSGISCLVR